jgi:YesN/AraC family two-component response regulator
MLGLELYQTHLSDIVITDIRMPIMNGLEFSRQILQYGMPVVIILLTDIACR